MSGRQRVEGSTKHFSEQLNRSLDEIGAPIGSRERAVVLSKMLNIPKQQAWGLLEGQIFPDDALLHQIANELEIDFEDLRKG